MAHFYAHWFNTVEQSCHFSVSLGSLALRLFGYRSMPSWNSPVCLTGLYNPVINFVRWVFIIRSSSDFCLLGLHHQLASQDTQETDALFHRYRGCVFYSLQLATFGNPGLMTSHFVPYTLVTRPRQLGMTGNEGGSRSGENEWLNQVCDAICQPFFTTVLQSTLRQSIYVFSQWNFRSNLVLFSVLYRFWFRLHVSIAMIACIVQDLCAVKCIGLL